MTPEPSSGALRVVHVSHSDLGGGAARAAFRLHRALRAVGVDSRMLVVDRQSDDDDVLAHRPASRFHRVLRRWVRPRLQRYEDRWYARHGDPISLNLVPSGILDSAMALRPDVVHLHWIGRETVSIAELGRAAGPLVWTLHDMWAFAGAHHYDDLRPGSVWRSGATAQASPWLEKATWRRKAAHWRNARFQFVTPSDWLARTLSESALFRGQQAAVIPCAVDLQLFRPCDRAWARERLGIPADRPVVCFGAVSGLQDPRKGGAVLLEALRRLSPTLLQRRPLFCVFGESRPQTPPDVPIETVWLGDIRDERLLPLVYASANVTVVPSRMENLPQTALEAQACGCPVVTFAATGMPETVEDRRTGFVAAAGSAAGLAEGIEWVLADDARARSLGGDARARAEALWSSDTVAKRHVALYRSVATSDAKLRAPSAFQPS